MSRRPHAKDKVEDIVQHVQELLGRLKLFDNFDWASVEGRPFEATHAKWSKNAMSEGVIGLVNHEGNRIVAFDAKGNELFAIGGGSPWKWSKKDNMVSITKTQSAKLAVDMGEMPYTEVFKYRIYLPE